MRDKCLGCGALIQTDNPNEIGYIEKTVLEKHQDDFLCERCFKLKHYNKLLKVTIDEEDFLKNIEKIDKNALICNIVDAFDLEGTIINNINTLFKDNPILIIANKFDLFLRSNRPTKIKKYINWYLASIGINVSGVIVTSSKDLKGIEKLYTSLLETCTALNISNNQIYFFGMTNVGKSSLLKAIIKTVGTNDEFSEASKLVVSNTVGTTLGFNKLQVGDLTIVDTPGICNKKQVTYYLDKSTNDYAIPVNFVRPKAFQLNPMQTLFVEGFGWFSYYGENKCSFVAYFSNRLKLHRTKSTRALEFYEEHKDDIFRFPNEEERKRLGELKKIVFENIDDCEISLSGLGFLSFYGVGTIEVVTFENIGVTKRKQLV